MVDHSTLTDPELHEPKGVATATSGQVYAANGSGSGVWAKPFKYVGVASTYSTGAPYAHATTTGDTALNPTVATLNSSQFTVQTSPNLRLRYDGVEALRAHVTVNSSVTHAAGADRDLELVVFKNGAAVADSRVIETVRSGTYSVVTLAYDLSLVTNDYIEFFAKGSAAYTTNHVKFYASIEGHVV